jgi:hypothetical protein
MDIPGRPWRSGWGALRRIKGASWDSSFCIQVTAQPAAFEYRWRTFDVSMAIFMQGTYDLGTGT